MTFVDAANGWIVAHYSIYVTTDAGTTWSQEVARRQFSAISFVDRDHGWAVGDGGGIFKRTR